MEEVTKIRVAQFSDPAQRLGATYVAGQGTYIRLWAPKAEKVAILWEGGAAQNLTREMDGYHAGLFPDQKPGARYQFQPDDNKPIPDPASRFQPDGPHGFSQVVASDFNWTDDNWRGVPFSEWVIYEIHPGTFSPSHDFAGIIADLPRLKDLGVTTLEIMPVSQFSGSRNWGYDGVFPHAVQNSYGGPDGLKTLVDACHAHGLAIILDVVYNHMGPEGNVLPQCGPYFLEKYHTPWGGAINYDGAFSDDVRRYFLQTVWQWLTEYHFDGLRLDAVQMIYDNSPVPFLEEVARLRDAAIKRFGRSLFLSGESDMNDSRLVTPLAQNGDGFDAQWADDFHHVLHVLLTGQADGYFSGYTGGVEQLARVYEYGVAYDGQYSTFHKRRHGRSYGAIGKQQLIVETQNHDQIGNRLLGDRLSATLPLEKLKLAAAAVLLSPFTPLLFMGEEFAAKEPFTYFVSHRDDDLMTAIREGRAREWADFAWKETPPDPGAVETFASCVLHDKNPLPGSDGAEMFNFYRQLIALSKEIRQLDEPTVTCDAAQNLITLSYHGEQAKIIVALSFAEETMKINDPAASQNILSADHVRVWRA